MYNVWCGWLTRLCAVRSKWWNKVEMALMLETDPSEILNEIITAVRKGGKVSVVGGANARGL